jgi:hypothetical protein
VFHTHLSLQKVGEKSTNRIEEVSYLRLQI